MMCIGDDSTPDAGTVTQTAPCLCASVEWRARGALVQRARHVVQLGTEVH